MAAEDLSFLSTSLAAIGGDSLRFCSREGSPAESTESLSSLSSGGTSTGSENTFIMSGAARESVSPEPLPVEARIGFPVNGGEGARKDCHSSEAWAQDLYYKNELVNVKRSYRERMLVMKVRMKEEESALKRKIARLETEAVGLLATNARLAEIEEENRHLRETVTNLVTVLAEANKPEPKRLKLS
eukprot:TRINITY_DN15502_c0_g1_i1.p1 TRINITY_DN15502_c0_g1~~TRINITY_DN15502_c0_g1_i1.p1  ORF type:complete len:186 (-),score=28.59 TRINITY_DN15502_c0_g1_i1:440-997(-)